MGRSLRNFRISTIEGWWSSRLFCAPCASLGVAAKHSPATGAEGAEISHHAGGDCIRVRNVIAAKPPSFVLAHGPLFRRPLRDAGRRRKRGHQRKSGRHGEAKHEMPRRAAVVDFHIWFPFMGYDRKNDIGLPVVSQCHTLFDGRSVSVQCRTLLDFHQHHSAILWHCCFM